MRSTCVFTTVFVAASILSGCAGGPTIGAKEQWTNPDYPESQLFYLETVDPVRGDGQQYYPLLSPREAVDAKQSVDELSPVTVLAQGVRLPRVWPSNFYAVVVVHVHLVGSPNDTDPLIVGTFPNAQPGQLLPFRSLRVFGQDTWTPDSPWEFQVQVIDLREKRNETVRRAIDQVELVIDRVNKIPSYYDPLVQIAIDGAKALLQQPNVAVIDFKVGMFSLPQVGQAGNVLPMMRKGAWLVAAKHKTTGPEYWEQPFVMNDRSRAIYAGIPTMHLESVDLPYLEIAIGAFVTQPGRSKVADDVSTLLSDVLSPRWEQDPAAVLSGANGVWSRTQVELAIRRFDQHPGEDTFASIVALLRQKGSLRAGDRDRLVLRFRAILGETRVNDDPDSIGNWWDSIGSEGTVPNGSWQSPVQSWLTQLEDPTVSNTTFVNNRKSLLPKLLAAPHGDESRDVTATAAATNSTATSPREKVTGITESEKALILAFFTDLAQSWDASRPVLDSAADLARWWKTDGIHGEIVRDDYGKVRWKSRCGMLADRLATAQVALSDVCLAASILEHKMLVPAGLGAAWSESDRLLFEAVQVTATQYDRQILAEALFAAIPEYELSAASTLERWWSDIGRYGTMPAGVWTSPIDSVSERFWGSGPLADLPMLRAWLDSPALTDEERQLLAARLVPSCFHATTGELPTGPVAGLSEHRARQWMAFVDNVQSQYERTKCLEASAGMCQFSAGWCVREALAARTPIAAQRIGVLHRALAAADANLQERASERAILVSFFETSVVVMQNGASLKESAIPRSDTEWELFDNGSWQRSGAGAQATNFWVWERPKPKS